MRRAVGLLLLGSWLLGCSAIVKFEDPPAGACGDGQRQVWEECDGTDLGGQSCTTLGHSSGLLGCNSDCELMTDGCGQSYCGDDVISPGEACDGLDLGEASCQSQGYDTGQIGCTSDCQLDESGCSYDNCGDDYCDTAAGESPSTCPSDCSAICGDGVCEVGRGETTADCYTDCAWQTVSVGFEFSCGTRLDGSVWCWGSNSAGKLGDGGDSDARWPVRVQVIEDGMIIAAGQEHACATEAGGGIRCWGHGGWGQLGYGNVVSQNTPQQVSGGLAANRLSAGGDATCVTQLDGSAWCWGSNTAGQLGVGNITTGELCSMVPCTDEPLQVAVLQTAQDISVGLGVDGATHACAIDNGQAWCWGANDLYQAGHDVLASDATPVQVLGLDNLTMIAAGQSFTCAARIDGSVWCWGDNSYGQLGNDSQTPDPVWTPQQVQGIYSSSIVWLSAGQHHACVVGGDEVAYCWGRNDSGQLGNDGQTNAPTATLVELPVGVGSISAGSGHTCAVVSDGVSSSSLFCWGDNSRGQLGDGTLSPSMLPVEVVDPLPPDPP